MSKAVIFGVSKVAEVLFQTIKDDKSDVEISAFCVDEEYLTENSKNGIPVVSFEKVQELFPPNEYEMYVAIGYHDLNDVRKTKCDEAIKKGYVLPSYVSSRADVASNASIGSNTFIFNGAIVGPYCVIGDDNQIYSGAVISHHVNVGNHNWITSGTVVGGNTTIGNNCFIGIGSTIGHNITLGDYNFLGTNAVITKNTEDNSVYIVADTPKYRLDSKRFTKLFKFD
ncbi:MAG: acetyltransferase [Butyrivibrio sp.]|uniref:acetyltransferase n=1 Tax=Butyrivibrio sp. TaxID=28121 RepID=UPI0025C64BBF|nr:acetyltransferase [Butyrivibrio sp.]MBQ6587186.1 acetyltransferase [Butyrivibrio sp.]